METKRTKLWRRKQGFRVFKARMIYYASFERECYYADGSHHIPLHWFELAKEPWAWFPNIFITGMAKQANADDNITFQRQLLLGFQELLLETGASAERDYLVVLNHFCLLYLFFTISYEFLVNSRRRSSEAVSGLMPIQYFGDKLCGLSMQSYFAFSSSMRSG